MPGYLLLKSSSTVCCTCLDNSALPFPAREFRAASRRLCPPMADKVRGRSARSVFSEVHVPRKNGSHLICACGRKLCEAFPDAEIGTLEKRVPIFCPQPLESRCGMVLNRGDPSEREGDFPLVLRFKRYIFPRRRGRLPAGRVFPRRSFVLWQRSNSKQSPSGSWT